MEKGLRVLGAFGAGKQFMTLREIAEACGIDKSAAQRFTHTLAQLGYLDKCGDTKRFSLGQEGARAVVQLPARQHAGGSRLTRADRLADGRAASA